MRQKKSKKIFYIIGLVLVVGILFVASRETNINVEQVEKVLDNNFTR